MPGVVDTATRSIVTSSYPETGYSPVTSRPWTPLDNLKLHPVLILFVSQVPLRDLDEAVASAFKQLPVVMARYGIKSGHGFLRHANDMLGWVPTEHFGSKNVYEKLCLFTFVMNQAPLKNLQTPVHPDLAGEPMTWLSSWMVVYTQIIGLFLDSPASLTAESLQAFTDNPLYEVSSAIVPEGGWRTFNEFFGRRLRPGTRPLAGPGDDKIIVYPADCTFDGSVNGNSIARVDEEGVVRIKGLPWTIESLLQDCRYRDAFNGGVWMHAFLDTHNYHRQHAPVSGVVLEAKNIAGAVTLQVGAQDGELRLTSQMDASSSTAFQFLQARACVVIESPVVGKVAILAVGMSQVSSVRLLVKKGDIVSKGNEICFFQFGGSDVVCVFDSKAGLRFEDFVPSPEGTFSRVNSVLAVAP